MKLRGVATAVAVLLAYLVVGPSGAGAQTSRVERCATIAGRSEARRAQVTGDGPTVAVIGDSYAMGTGLADPSRSWPSRLEGRVVVDGFGGSGFTPEASPCRATAFSLRARAALATRPSLVVVEGGLNDFDVTGEAIRAGAREVLRRLAGRRVVVVGPPSAPSRAAAVGRVDAILAEVAAEAGVPYVRTLAWDLTYLPDRLHLTPPSHELFGDRVAVELDRILVG